MAGAMQASVTASPLYVGRADLGANAPAHSDGYLAVIGGAKYPSIDPNNLTACYYNTLGLTTFVNFTTNPTCGTSVSLCLIMNNGVAAVIPNNSSVSWQAAGDPAGIVPLTPGAAIPVYVYF